MTNQSFGRINFNCDIQIIVCQNYFLIGLFQKKASKEDRNDFLSEAAILGQFSDPNVIFLEGVILQGKFLPKSHEETSDALSD